MNDDPIAKFGTALLYNFTRPEKSPILLAPLAKAAGGWECCPGVYEDREDPHYQEQLARIRRRKGFGIPSLVMLHLVSGRIGSICEK